MRRAISLLIVVASIVAACGSDESASTSTSAASTTTTTSPTTTATLPTTTSTITGPTTSTSVAETTTTTGQEIDVEFANGEVAGAEMFQVDLGDTVDIWVLSDVDDEMHVHGYDLFYDLEAGVPFHLDFVADVPGIFEVEVHTGHTRLFDIEVSG